MTILAHIFRVLLILLAVRYLWKALRASFSPPPSTPPASHGPTGHPVLGDAEDIDYEDIP
jgi:hypothetical protein